MDFQWPEAPRGPRKPGSIANFHFKDGRGVDEQIAGRALPLLSSAPYGQLTLGPRVCHFCGDALLGVKHVFLECVALRQQQRILSRRVHPLPVLRDLLTVHNVNKVKVFLGQIGLLEHV